MTLRFPLHLLSTNQGRRLIRIVSDRWKAELIVWNLWQQLGCELEDHGAAGFISNAGIYMLETNMSYPMPSVGEKLVASGFLTRMDGGAECRLFAFYNRMLDINYIEDDSDASYAKFISHQDELGRESIAIIEHLDPLSCLLDSGVKMDMDQLKRVIMLIKTVDSALGLGQRPPREYETPIIHCAAKVWSSFSVKQVERVCFRLFQKRKSPQGLGFPRRTIWVLENFPQVDLAVAPPDGWVEWAKSRSGHAGQER